MAIEGGYIIKAKKIRESAIAHCSPCVREIFDWLLLEANFKDTKVCKRGQLIRSYEDILEGLHWYSGWRKMRYSKAACGSAMETLKEHAMVTTAKTTRGMLITIVNYDKYQTFQNYGDNNGDNNGDSTETTARRHYKEVMKSNGSKEVNNLASASPPPEKTESEEKSKEPKPNIPALVVSEFYRLKGWDKENAPARSFASHLRPAKQLIEITGGFDGAAKKLSQVKAWAEARDLEWSIETIFKKWEEIEKPVQERAKKPYIEGDRAYEKNGDWYIINHIGEHKKYMGSLKNLTFR